VHKARERQKTEKAPDWFEECLENW
jgi:hypothetical protein